MKGKIDSQGRLCIWRERWYGYREQQCRIMGMQYVYCGHDCSLFSEPEVFDEPTENGQATVKRTMLALCMRTLYFEELLDEREG